MLSPSGAAPRWEALWRAMARRLTRSDRWLLGVTLPLFLAALGLHVHETARSGLAQLPVLAEWQPGDHPRVGGYRLETDSSGSGLEIGDRLIRVGQRDLRGVGYVGFHAIGLSLTRPGDPVPLVFERDGERRTVPLEARPHPQPWSRIPILLLIPLFCVPLLLRAPGQPDVQRFYLCFMTYAIGQAQFYGGPEWKSWAAAAVWSVASVLMLFFMLRWVRLFPAEMPDARRVPAWLPAAAAAVYVVFVRANYVLAWPLPIEWVPRVSYALHGGMSVLGVLVLGWNYVHAWPAGRRRLRWILLGTALGSAPVVAAGVVPLLVPGWEGFRQAFAVGFLASAVWMMGAVMAVVRDNAFDVDRLIGATAAWAVAAAATVAGLALALPALSEGASRLLGVDLVTTRLGFAAALGALAIPLALGLRSRVDRLLFPARVALQRRAEAILEELAWCEGPDALLALGRRRAGELFGARGSALYRREGGTLRLREAEGLSLPEAPLPGAPLPASLRPRNARAAFGREAEIALPLRPQGRTEALLVLGPRRSGDIYTTSDIGVLAALAARLEAEWLRFRVQAVDRESRAKTNLLAAAGHDLRQPLHAVALLTDALGDKLDDPALRSLVGRIGDSVHDLDDMLTGLLDRSKLDAGVRPQIGTVALGPLFTGLERDFAPPAEAAGLRLRVVPTRLAVRSDRQLLARILRNLVSNALRHTRQGSVLVGARPRGEEVVVEVRDSGPGIPEGSRGEIFRAFRQLPGTRPGGLGLGLSIVEGLARVLGHAVHLRSAPGRGSTFSVHAPRAAVALAPGAPPAERAAPGAPAVRRVLVVDDDPRSRDAQAAALRGWGCEVRAATSAAEALEVANAWRPEFVLSDHRLGAGSTGAGLLAELRRCLGPDLRAALVTAETDAAAVEALRATGLPVLRKPVRPARLRALLSTPPGDVAVAGAARPRETPSSRGD